MITEIEEFILIPMTLEVEETPAPGTSPEAPDGPDYQYPEEGEDLDDPEIIEVGPHDRDHVGGFEFPEDTPTNFERNELTEVPAPGTSPEAPGGPGYVRPDKEEKGSENSDEWRDYDGNTDGYDSPEKKDDDLL